MLDIGRESNIEILRQACYAYDAGVRTLAQKNHQLLVELARLQGLDVSQIVLDLPEILIPSRESAQEPHEATADKAAPGAAAPPRRAPQTGHGPRSQPRLPIEEVLHAYDSLPECTVCGRTMDLMGGQYESADEITVVETQFKVTTHHRQKYRCGCNAQVVTAPGPDKLLPGGRYSVAFAVHSAVAKFCDHLPLTRQCRMMARQGLDVDSQTLWDQQAALAVHLEPTWRELTQQVLTEEVLHVDETGWKLMAGRGERGSAKWALFGLTTPEIAAYHLLSTKSAAARKILAGFTGTLVVDGYAVYPLVAALEGAMRIAHCWAHADRKFKDAKDPPAAIAKVRSLIAKLYEIERKVEGPFPGSRSAQRERLKLRAEESAKIIGELRAFALAQGGLRRSAFGKALRYMLSHWDGLTVFLTDPRVPLDNNAAERVLRGPVVGRKNFYGSRSRRGAKVAAILYSLIETAKLQGRDPRAYLLEAARAAIRTPGTVTLPR